MKKIVLFIVLIASLGLQAQTTHTVINTNDSGLGSLRAAADSAVAGDTIRLSPSLIASGSDTIVLTTGEIGFYTNGVVIKGLYTTTDTLFISGNNNSRIFSFIGAGKIILDSLVLVNGNGTGAVHSGEGGAVCSISCSDTLFVKNSIISGNTSSNWGGGISSSSYFYILPSVVIVTNSRISGNTSSLGDGGGISSYSNNDYSRVIVTNSTISGNTSSLGNGGGFYSSSSHDYSSVIVTNSIITGNTSSLGNGGGISSYSNDDSSSVLLTSSRVSGNTANKGGGICSYSDSYPSPSSSLVSSVSIVNSSVSGNIASNSGGGIYSYSLPSPFQSYSSVSIENSTVSGNIANSYGGGVYSYGTNSSTIFIANSTISGNISFNSGGGIWSSSLAYLSSSTVSVINSTISGNVSPNSGGGIYSNSYSSSSINVTSSIVAENGNNISGIYNNHTPTIISGGYNIFSDTLSGTISFDSTNITSTQLNLQVLAFNGGTTQTMYPGAGSIAIDLGNPNDSSNAQNAPIVGTRDVGAAEGCFALPTSVFIKGCNSYTLPSGNSTYTQSGVYYDTILTNCGADSIVTINLSMVSQYTTIDTIIACSSYTWINGVSYTSNNNTAMDTLLSSSGCDSIVTLDLTILQPSSGIEVVTACDHYTWNGVTYTSSNNTALDTLVNAVGCDSIVTLDLTILNSTSSIETITECDSYTSPSGNVWTNSGTYLDTIPNSVNCDSVVTIHLTINTTQYTTDVISACSSYTWIDGVTYISNNNMAVDTLVSSSGCDSIVTLDLTILQPSSSLEVVTACDSFIWNGITYTSSNNTALDTLVNAVGCDSIVTLNLTINNTQYITDVVSACDSYIWIDGITYTSNNNAAVDTLISSSGCDSIITLDLTILNSTSFTDVITSCSPIVWLDGVTYSQTTNGSTYTIINGQGCDSIVTLDFTLLDVDTSVTRNYLTLTAQATNATYQWIDCLNGPMAGETNTSFTATVNGNYQVEVTQNGCVDTSACFTITNVGVQEAELIGVSLYPNPTSDVLHIDKGSNQSLEIKITNSAGTMVFQSTSKSQITSIDMSKMAIGIYVVALKNELEVKVEKVVKR